MAELLSVPRIPIQESGEVVSIDAERQGKHRRVFELAERLASLMRTEPDKDAVFDAHKLAIAFWLR